MTSLVPMAILLLAIAAAIRYPLTREAPREEPSTRSRGVAARGGMTGRPMRSRRCAGPFS